MPMHRPTPSPPRRLGLALLMLAAATLAGCTTVPSTALQASDPATTRARPTEAVTDEAALQRGFAEWVAAYRKTARAAGIDEATLHAAFDEVQYLPRVVELDRAQPEFTRAIWDYLDSAITSQRVDVDCRTPTYRL